MPVLFKLSCTLPTDDMPFNCIAVVCFFIFVVTKLPSCNIKFLDCIRNLVVATKSSPREALEPLPGADPANRSIIWTTEPISVAEEASELGDEEPTFR